MEHTELVRTINNLDLGPSRNQFLLDRAFPSIIERPKIKQDMQLILDAMRKNVRTLILSDNARALQYVYDSLLASYRTNIVGVGTDQKFFERKTRKVSYVSADYLLDEGVVDAVKSVYQAASAYFNAREMAVPAVQVT